MRLGLLAGAAAGAAGTTALDAATYLDMTVRGRPASDVPTRVVELSARRLGRDVPGRGDVREHRVEGLGAVAGILTGVGVGSVAGAMRRRGRRLGPLLGPLLIGGAAMAATDLSMAMTGVSDPRQWTRADWLADAVPHLAYGIVTHATLAAMDHR